MCPATETASTALSACLSEYYSLKWYSVHTSISVDTLLESGLTVVIYSGQLDLICATSGQLTHNQLTHQ